MRSWSSNLLKEDESPTKCEELQAVIGVEVEEFE